MRKIRKKTVLYLFFLFACCNFANVSDAFENDSLLTPKFEFEINNKTKNSSSSYFNLANIVDSFLSNETKNEENILDKKAQIRKDFISITSKFNQGNAAVAYDEYEELINKVDNDNALLSLSKVFYEIGFFSLASKATEKIVYKNQFYDNISDLEKSYLPKTALTKEEEIYFAKLYSEIYFNNSSKEAISELAKYTGDKLKNDYYAYLNAIAYNESKNYTSALNSINKAISLNPKNINYRLVKCNILKDMQKYKDADKLIKKLSGNEISLNLSNKILTDKESILFNISNNDKEKKYHSIKKTYLEGNYEKAKKDALNILNFDKNNDKIISLAAKSELALGNIDKANMHFVNAYKINKSNPETIIGLGDIKYLHGDYKNAVKMYKKAYSGNKKNYEALIKYAEASRQYAKNPKELKKLEALLDKMPKSANLAYYESAISIAQKNSVLKEDFLKRSLNIDPMNEKALGELTGLYLKSKNYDLAKGLIYNVAFTLEKNYYYYYLCGIYNQAINKKSEAMRFFKTSLNLNPNFEIANKKLLKLIPDTSGEEI